MTKLVAMDTKLKWIQHKLEIESFIYGPEETNSRTELCMCCSTASEPDEANQVQRDYNSQHQTYLIAVEVSIGLKGQCSSSSSCSAQIKSIAIILRHSILSVLYTVSH